ncbi:hypothetical protein CHS0354_018601, partial [Potamilus streckersoni]
SDVEETSVKIRYSPSHKDETRPKITYSPSDVEETSVKIRYSPSHKDETRSKITYSPSDVEETSVKIRYSPTKTDKEQRCGFSLLKFTIFTVLILGTITAVIIIIIVLRDSSPLVAFPTPENAAKTQDENGCTALGVNLGDSVIIVCNISSENVWNVSIKLPSTASLNKTILLTNQTRTNEGWTMNYTPKQNITLTGPQAKCSSAGNYSIDINGTDKSSSSSQIVPLAINEDPELVAVSDLNMTKLNCSKEAQCISRTQCQDRYSLRMFPSIKPATVFSQICYINYSDSSGWTSICRGSTQTDFLNVSYTVECMLSDTKLTITKNITIC